MRVDELTTLAALTIAFVRVIVALTLPISSNCKREKKVIGFIDQHTCMKNVYDTIRYTIVCI